MEREPDKQQPAKRRRRRAASVQALAQEHTGTAIETLVGICGDQTQSASVRIAAAQALLDRGHGKAVAATLGTKSSTTASALIEALEGLDDDERAALEASLGGRAAQSGTRGGAAG